MNKYNVRAVRQELDDCMRNCAWTRFGLRLESLYSHPKLLKLVVLAKSKLTNGSLLHGLIKYHHDCILSLATSIAHNVPHALFVQDRQRQTPLHLAIDHYQHPKMIQTFLEILNKATESQEQNEHHRQPHPLTMTDQQGDTPLLRAVRLDASQYFPIFLKYMMDNSDKAVATAVLIPSKRKQRTAIWYVAINELQNAIKNDQYVIPEDLRWILLATHFALLQEDGGTPMDDTSDWDIFRQELHSAVLNATGDLSSSTCSAPSPTKEEGAAQLSLVMRSIVATSHLLGKHAVKLLDLILANPSYCGVVFSKEIDLEGNYLLHHICTQKTTRLTVVQNHSQSTTVRSSAAGTLSEITDTLSAAATATTNALLLEQLLQDHELVQTSLCHPNRHGNMPLHLAMATHKDYVPALGEAYPNALMHKNCQGESPLHIALKVPLAEPTMIPWKLKIIEDFWKRGPGTLESRDGPTGLYPYQLAACGYWAPLCTRSHKAAEQSENIEEKEVLGSEWLTLIFTMLLAAPQVVVA